MSDFPQQLQRIESLNEQSTKTLREDEDVDYDAERGWSEWQILMKPNDADGFINRSTKKADQPGYKTVSFSFPDEPGVYELKIERDSENLVVYIGKGGSIEAESTSSLRRRVRRYLLDGSHLAEYIDSALQNGFIISGRYWKNPEIKDPAEDKSVKEDVVAQVESEYLQKFDYAWNAQKNGETRWENVLGLLNMKPPKPEPFVDDSDPAEQQPSATSSSENESMSATSSSVAGPQSKEKPSTRVSKVIHQTSAVLPPPSVPAIPSSFVYQNTSSNVSPQHTQIENEPVSPYDNPHNLRGRPSSLVAMSRVIDLSKFDAKTLLILVFILAIVAVLIIISFCSVILSFFIAAFVYGPKKNIEKSPKVKKSNSQLMVPVASWFICNPVLGYLFMGQKKKFWAIFSLQIGVYIVCCVAASTIGFVLLFPSFGGSFVASLAFVLVLLCTWGPYSAIMVPFIIVDQILLMQKMRKEGGFIRDCEYANKYTMAVLTGFWMDMGCRLCLKGPRAAHTSHSLEEKRQDD